MKNNIAFQYGTFPELRRQLCGKAAFFYNHADPDNNQSLITEKKWIDDYFLMNLKVSQEIGGRNKVS
jgi:hypothetical protein